jgi:hypothetical protein
MRASSVLSLPALFLASCLVCQAQEQTSLYITQWQLAPDRIVESYGEPIDPFPWRKWRQSDRAG